MDTTQQQKHCGDRYGDGTNTPFLFLHTRGGELL